MFTILLTLVTTSAAYTTHSPHHIDSNSNHRSFLPVLTLNFGLRNSNGHQTGETHQFPIIDAVVKLSDLVYQGHGSDIHRRADEHHIYQLPHRHSNGPWNRQPGATSTQFNNGNNKNTNTDYVQEQDSWKQETIIDPMNENDRYNRPVDDRKNVNKQSDDVDDNQHNISNNYTRYNETTLNQGDYNVNINNRTISVPILVNNTTIHVTQGPSNVYQGSPNNKTDENTNKFTELDKIYINTNRTTNMNGTNVNRNVNRDNKYGSKTTQDNEVTSTKEDSQDDRWIWSNGEVETTSPIVTTTDSPGVTTTLTPLDDRASFAGDACPTGQVKFQGQCIDTD